MNPFRYGWLIYDIIYAVLNLKISKIDIKLLLEIRMPVINETVDLDD